MNDVRDRALNALQRARTPGFHFPGWFLDVRWDREAPEGSRLWIPFSPHVLDARDDIDLLALCVMADTTLGAAMRASDGTSRRFGTISLHLQFTGLAARGDLQAKGAHVHTADDTELQQRQATVELSTRDGLVAHGNGAFVALPTPPDVALGPLPWQQAPAQAATGFDESTASPAERDALARIDALRAAGRRFSLEDFWLGTDRGDAGSALRIPTGAHTGNRVGHVQGGLLLGIAAWMGRRAAPASMRLANVTSWYVSPGRGMLVARSRVVHNGRNTALVENVIESDDGELVLHALSQHTALAGAQS